jgi:hypothetical protein
MSPKSIVIDTLFRSFLGELTHKDAGEGYHLFYSDKDSEYAAFSKNTWGRLWIDNDEKHVIQVICLLRENGFDEIDIINYFLEKYGIEIKDVKFLGGDSYDSTWYCR